MLAPLHRLRHLALIARTIDSRIQLVCDIARVGAGCRRGAAAACGRSRGGGRGGCDGLALVIDGSAGVVTAGHAGG